LFGSHTRAAEPLQPVTLSFEKITVVQFLSLVYGDILKTNYALDPDLVDFPKTVTVHIQSGFDKPKLTAFVSDLLASVGVVVEQKNGYVFVRPIRETVDKPDIDAPMELFFYRAKYRPVSMLIDLTASLFKTGHAASRIICYNFSSRRYSAESKKHKRSKTKTTH
jgi:hypothetical protein